MKHILRPSTRIAFGFVFCVILSCLSACSWWRTETNQRIEQAAGCTGDACNAVAIRISTEYCYQLPTEPGYRVYLDNNDAQRSVTGLINQHVTYGIHQEDRPTFPDPFSVYPGGKQPVGCTQYFAHTPPPDHVEYYTYNVVTANFIQDPTPGPTPGPPPHGPLSDADCATSTPPPGLANDHGVYMLQLAAPPPDDNACLGYDIDPGDDDGVKILNCQQAQTKMFTLFKRANGCYQMRNGNVRVPPESGRCLDVEKDDTDEVKARACNQSNHQLWKLFQNSDQSYNLINQAFGKCIDRDSGGASDAHVVDCNNTQWQRWRIRFIRPD